MALGYMSTTPENRIKSLTHEYKSNKSMSSFCKPDESNAASSDFEIDGLEWKFGRSQTDQDIRQHIEDIK